MMAWQVWLTVGMLAAVPALHASAEPGDHVGDTLTLARRADSAYLVRDWPDAADRYGRLVELNPTVGLYWHRLGEARFRAKQFAEAVAPLERAAELGGFQPHPPRWVHRGESAYLLAAAHAALGNRDESLRWTRTALSEGLRDIRKFHAAPFAEMAMDPEFAKLVWADVDSTEGLSRVDGYRRDLRFAVHELKRVHFSPFRATGEAEIDALVAALDEEIPNLSDDQILVRLMAIVRCFGDAHTRILQEQPQLGVLFFSFPEGTYIYGATADHADLVGAKVLRVGQRPIDEVQTMVEGLVAVENPMTARWQACGAMQSLTVARGLGLAPADGPLEIEVEDASGRTHSVKLSAVDERRRARTTPMPCRAARSRCRFICGG